MPRFFFHFMSHDGISRDDVGTEFPSLEAAYLDCCQSALEMSMDKLRARNDPTNDSVEITDESGHLLMNIPFLEVLRPRQGVGVQTDRRATHDAIEACQRQMLRSDALRSELRAEYQEIQSTFQSIRAKLEILTAGHWPA